MKDSKDLFRNEYKSKIETKNAEDNNPTIFPLDPSLKELIDSLFLLLITLVMLIEFKETVIENLSFQE